VEPRPLRAGSAFRGVLEVSERLDLARTRVELKLQISTSWSSDFGLEYRIGEGLRADWESRRAVTEHVTLWRGTLTEIQAGALGPRYAFEGALASAPTPTVVLAHGNATARIDVVIDRRMRGDRHFDRPVAIATG
jgi:hypothetical protein